MQEQNKILLKHSGLGKASFIISILVLICYLIMFFLGDTVIKITYQIMLIILIILNVTGVGLGIAGARKKNARIIFALLGLIFNGILLYISITFTLLSFFPL